MTAATIDTELGPIREPGSESPPKKTMKFTYPNGSTPLDGYTIKRGIGTGGFGEVYFAVTPAGKEVALKRVQRNLDIELRGVAHCLNLKHPNLLQLFDVRRNDDGEAWVVMEYIAGSNLRELLDQHPAGLDREQVDHWFGQLAAAVAHLHANGIVHRDLKPANVFEDNGIVKLGDYGLSKFISCSRRGGHTESVGTFHYMAPEIGRGEYGKEIDIYALGVILFELLTGRVPFEGESGHEIVMKHLTAQPDLSIVPEPYRRVVAQALAKSPQARQASVAELLAPLSLSLDQQGLLRRENQIIQAPKPQPFTPYPNPSPTDPYNVHSDLSSNTSEEPVYRALRTSVSHVRMWWQSLEQNPLLRFAVLLGAVTLLLINSSWLGPVVSMLVLMYLPYYIIRQIILDSSPQPGPTLYVPTVAGLQPAPVRMPRKKWMQLARLDLAKKTKLQRSAELSSSWAVATVGLAIAYGIAALIYSRHGDTQLATLAPLMWSGMVALLGTWMTLFIGKLCEPVMELAKDFCDASCSWLAEH